jgi:hypothetical protein
VKPLGDGKPVPAPAAPPVVGKAKSPEGSGAASTVATGSPVRPAPEAAPAPKPAVPTDPKSPTAQPAAAKSVIPEVKPVPAPAAPDAKPAVTGKEPTPSKPGAPEAEAEKAAMEVDNAASGRLTRRTFPSRLPKRW